VRGPGYSGLLTDTATRLPGLISIADVAHSVRALQRGERPRSAPGRADPLARLARFDRRLDQAHDSRLGATIVLVVLMLALSARAASRAAPRGPGRLPRAAGLHRAAVALSASGRRRRRTPLRRRAARGGGGASRRALPPPRLPLALALGAFFACSSR
jgi:hypothetical protein